MIKLWLANVAPDASDDDIRKLVKTYAPELECTDVQREEGDGTRPVAFVAVPGAKRDALDKACARLNGMFWKERKLSCTTTMF
jgi:RNA recognition motif. (a.k.a. RRM, RBD, or RNP domain)